MKNLSLFQLVVFGICGVLIIGGVLVFAALSRGGASSVGMVVIWGTLPQASMDTLLQNLREKNSSFENVSYKQMDASSYDSDLINAIASGEAPDLALLSADEIMPFQNKLYLIPYTSMSKSEYQSSFVGEGDLFLNPNGILALPFTLDPLVMYWNKDLFSAAGLAEPPQYWDDVLTDTPKLTTLSSRGITTSAIAMGEWDNVSDAKAILSALTMQAGDPITSVDAATGKVSIAYGESPSQSIESPASSALSFYTDFADPSKISYTWNRTLPLSQEAFAAGDLAIYLGLASEDAAIAARNPNLNFGVAELPQAKGEATPVTFGNLTGLTIPRGAKNYQGAVKIAELLSGDAGASGIASALHLPPVRRDLIAASPTDPNATAFAESALIAHGWLDPDPSGTDSIFQSMIESVLSGQNEPAAAVSQAALALQRLLQQ
ncbi:MAG: extracellular solute-binding protein [Minisyncoccia bacterium]